MIGATPSMIEAIKLWGRVNLSWSAHQIVPLDRAVILVWGRPFRTQNSCGKLIFSDPFWRWLPLRGARGARERLRRSRAALVRFLTLSLLSTTLSSANLILSSANIISIPQNEAAWGLHIQWVISQQVRCPQSPSLDLGYASRSGRPGKTRNAVCNAVVRSRDQRERDEAFGSNGVVTHEVAAFLRSPPPNVIFENLSDRVFDRFCRPKVGVGKFKTVFRFFLAALVVELCHRREIETLSQSSCNCNRRSNKNSTEQQSRRMRWTSTGLTTNNIYTLVR